MKLLYRTGQFDDYVEYNNEMIIDSKLLNTISIYNEEIFICNELNYIKYDTIDDLINDILAKIDFGEDKLITFLVTRFIDDLYQVTEILDNHLVISTKTDHGTCIDITYSGINTKLLKNPRLA